MLSVESQSYLLVIGSAACFSAASLIFADFSRKISPIWINAFKALVAWVCFCLAQLAVGSWSSVSFPVIAALSLSGVLGLAIGDLFLMTAYSRIGAGRSLVLFGFQPLLVAIEAKIFFGQSLSLQSMLALVFLLACLFTFSLEKFKEHGHWELMGLGAGLLGVLFDNLGLMLSRWSFEQVPGLSSFQANVFRCTGALLFFAFYSRIHAIHLWQGYKKLGSHRQKLAIFASFLGAFFSLYLYLSAVRIGQLASISALAGIGPIFTSTLECIYHRKRPSIYLLVALSFFGIGFGLLNHWFW